MTTEFKIIESENLRDLNERITAIWDTLEPRFKVLAVVTNDRVPMTPNLRATIFYRLREKADDRE